jgi:hypothetical protein
VAVAPKEVNVAAEVIALSFCWEVVGQDRDPMTCHRLPA